MAHAVCRELHHGLARQHHPQLAAQAHGGFHWKGTQDGHSHRESPAGPPWLYPRPSLPHSPHSYLAQPHTFSTLCRNSSSSWDFSHWVGQRQSAPGVRKPSPTLGSSLPLGPLSLSAASLGWMGRALARLGAFGSQVAQSLPSQGKNSQRGFPTENHPPVSSPRA